MRDEDDTVEDDVPPSTFDAGPPHPHDQADAAYSRDRRSGPYDDGEDDGLAFSVGDLVVDRDRDPDDRGSMVVLRYPRDADGVPVVAEGYEIAALDKTVHAVNEDYPADDPVVEVAFEGWLDSHVPAWRGLLADARDLGEPFYDLLGEFCHEWGVSKRTYSYPESRLDPRPWCRVCGEKAEFVADEGGYYCPDDDVRAVYNEAIDACDVGDRPPDEADERGGP